MKPALKSFVFLSVAAAMVGGCSLQDPIAGAPETVYFAFDREAFDQDGVATVSRMAYRAVESGAGAVLAAGFADAPGDPEYNQALSLRRAETVRRNLIARGVPPAVVTAVGLGEASDGADPEPENRRVEIELGEPGALPRPPEDRPYAFPLPGPLPVDVEPLAVSGPAT
jgi:outer membrane protein OmpA-like peptidoglycan-associated protein